MEGKTSGNRFSFNNHSTTIQISFKHTIVIQTQIIQSIQLKHITMKEEDLSLIKRYPIVEYLERKGIKPVRR
ncbi:MAG: hypothetical protein ACTTKN_11225, partial [Phocaeicola sp.]